MTIIIKYDDKGKPQFRSPKGFSNEHDREKAIQLDELLKKELASLEIRLKKHGHIKNNSKGRLIVYWELGKVLRDIFYDSGLIHLSEINLFWIAARMHTPDLLLAKDRGPNRLHLEYCFRVAGIDKSKALLLKWGEWVYLFDSPGINKESRFDKWFEDKISNSSSEIERKEIRTLAVCINNILGYIETADLNESELYRCYDIAWHIKQGVKDSFSDKKEKEITEKCKIGIRLNFTKIGEVIDNKLSPIEFCNYVLESF